MEQLEVGSLKIDLVRKAIKNIHLAVYPPTGRVRIAAPTNANIEALKMFALSKYSWIKRHQRKFEKQERLPSREYVNRESHYFKGKRYLLNIVECNSSPKVIIKNNSILELQIRKDVPRNKRNEIFDNWYREELKIQIPKFLKKWQGIMNVQINDCRIKKMKTKWGSCNIKEKRIWINLELAKKPEICLEYIIVHEMIHLFERHHNERFLFYMNKYFPNWKKIKKELNNLPIYN